MVSARRRAQLLILLILSACAPPNSQADQRAEKAELLLLTGLPLAFGESFSLEATSSPVLEALEQRYRVTAIPTTSAEALKGAKLLLMAQPMAQPAEDLVALDRWVREGGKVLLLADPLLEWGDSRPLDDPTRPPPMFMDTGLLGHWGLRLDLPERRGEVETEIAGTGIVARSPGTLHGSCAKSSDGLVARCKLGKGEAVVVADADFLDWSRPGGEAGRQALVAALEDLEHR